jgi:hypothetical protein
VTPSLPALASLAAAAVVAAPVATREARSAPAVVAVVASRTADSLTRADARTLTPLRGRRRLPLPADASVALSPGRARVVVAGEGSIVIANTITGRVVRRIDASGFDFSLGVHWLGAAGDAFVVAVGESKFGYEYTVLPGGASTDTDLAPVAALRDGLVLANDAGIDVYGRDGEIWIPLDLPRFRVVADVAHDRLFAVSPLGHVTELDDVGGDLTIRDHRVELSGREFEAIWGGHGRIVLWGADGLGVIDTRTWTTASLAAAATGAAATPFGLVAWDARRATGLDVYGPNDTRRLHVLAGRAVREVTALGRYAYARAGGKRFSIDLESGRVTRTPRNFRVVVPTLVPLP